MLIQHFNNGGPFQFAGRVIFAFPLTEVFILWSVWVGAGPDAKPGLFATLKFTNFCFRAILAAAAWPGTKFVFAYGILFAAKKIEFR